ncbi:class F sortase [Streptomyces sp. VNUA24]|uniref:class F sortase n=1 Tax=Streptomyces sp. VNUA24 TaxID=3031131 RepID=UPI0023B7B769|nr:class F sortase [Streptomyces sp. VNUA24]WEH19144.1 class F sortase [Streptomyces sp. VNUA24]
MTAALVVGGVHLAEHRERATAAEAPSAPPGSGARAAGAPGGRPSPYVTPPPSGEPARTPPSDAPPATAPGPDTGPSGRTPPPGRASRAPAEGERPLPGTGRATPKRSARPRTLPPSPARTLAIRYLGIEAPVTGLRLDSRRRLPAPPDDKPTLVGWYTQGPAPGGPGTAVVVGHRDTRTGPAVFAALDMIKPGRIVEVLRADGRTAVYTVDAVRTYEKSRFPDKKVYGHRGRPELRLITCGGTYDRRKGYASNVVVFAHLTATREPARRP